MKKYLFLLLVVLLVWSCGDDDGEAPVTTELVELSIPVTTSDFIDGGGLNVLEVTGDINLATEGFQDILDNISDYRVNLLAIVISSVEAGSQAPELVFVDMGVGETVSFSTPPNIIREDKRLDDETPLITALTDASGNLDNTATTVIYNRLDDVGSFIEPLNAGLEIIRDQFSANENLGMRIRMGVDGDPLSFTITVQFNLSVR